MISSQLHDQQPRTAKPQPGHRLGNSSTSDNIHNNNHHSPSYETNDNNDEKNTPPPVDRLQLHCSTVLAAADASNAIGDATPSAVFYNLTLLHRNFAALHAAFPQQHPNTNAPPPQPPPQPPLHCFAVKACPVVPLLARAADAGLGLECASYGEIHLCLAARVHPSRIVYDAPVKSDNHIQHALRIGVHINADSIEEVHRIAAALLPAPDSRPNQPTTTTTPQIGLRINPQLPPPTTTTSSSSSTAAAVKDYPELLTSAADSKFGVPLNERRQDILRAFRDHPFLSCVHVHVGSQGCPLPLLVDGVASAVVLADQVNAHRPGQIRSIDIGGGLSVDYLSDEPPDRSNKSPFALYFDQLRIQVPGLFKYRIITEFGRSLIAKAGWIAAKVQNVKRAGGHDIAMTHAGADILMRTVYMPGKWPHRLEVFAGDDFRQRQDNWTPMDVAGPLCFRADLIAEARPIPMPTAGDWLVVRDAGAYTLSCYSRHTSQLVPPVFGYEESTPKRLVTLKRAETPEDLIRFWGA